MHTYIGISNHAIVLYIGVMLVSGKEEKSTYISLILIQELYFSSFQSFSISRLAWGVKELQVPH